MGEGVSIRKIRIMFICLGFCLGLLCCLNNMKNFTSAGGCLFVSGSVIEEIEDLASGSIFASGSSHLDFATQDQIAFTLLPLGMRLRI